METNEPGWKVRSTEDADDEPEFQGFACVGVYPEDLDAYLEGEVGEPAMKRALAQAYENVDGLNFLRRHVEVLAYRRTDRREQAEPEMVLYDLRYRDAGRL